MLAVGHPDLFAAAASHSGVLSPLYRGRHPFAAPVQYLSSIDSVQAAWGGMWASVAPAFGNAIASWEARDPAHHIRTLKTAGESREGHFVDVGGEDGLVDQSRAFHAELTSMGIAH